MAAIFGEGKFFGKLQKIAFFKYPVGRKFRRNALSRTVKEIEANLCFAIFGKNSKIQNGHHFWKITKIAFLKYPVGRKFRRNALSRTVKEIEANLCFAIFGKNSKIQNGRHFWGGEIFLENYKILHSLDTLWVENFDEIALSRTVKEIEANLCLPFLARIQNGRHFWGGEKFLKIAKSTLLRYPVG